MDQAVLQTRENTLIIVAEFKVIALIKDRLHLEQIKVLLQIELIALLKVNQGQLLPHQDHLHQVDLQQHQSLVHLLDHLAQGHIAVLLGQVLADHHQEVVQVEDSKPLNLNHEKIIILHSSTNCLHN